MIFQRKCLVIIIAHYFFTTFAVSLKAYGTYSLYPRLILATSAREQRSQRLSVAHKMCHVRVTRECLETSLACVREKKTKYGDSRTLPLKPD